MHFGHFINKMVHLLLQFKSRYIRIVNLKLFLICLQQSALLLDKHGVHFPLATVRDFRFTLLNSIDFGL